MIKFKPDGNGGTNITWNWSKMKPKKVLITMSFGLLLWLCVTVASITAGVYSRLNTAAAIISSWPELQSRLTHLEICSAEQRRFMRAMLKQISAMSAEQGVPVLYDEADFYNGGEDK